MTEESSVPQDTFWWRLTHLEPATYRGLVLAVGALLAAIGVHFAPGIPDALIGVIVVLMPIIQGLWTRKAVVPNDKVVVALPDPIDRPGAVTAGAAVTTAGDHLILAAAHVAG